MTPPSEGKVAAGDHTSIQELRDQAVAISLLDRPINDQGQSQSHDLGPSQRPHHLASGNFSVEEEAKLRGRVEKKILSLLSYSVLTQRLESIGEPHVQTFHWIFEEPPRPAKWDSFIDWLSVGLGMYWIQGKVGSGKSTLMKYIFESLEAQKYLKQWAGVQSLRTAAFFFWNSGSTLERSQNGLLRSLLFTVLSQQPTLIAVVFPRLWAVLYSRLQSRGLHETEELDPWTNNELKAGFQRLISQELVPLKLFLLVDGLDEYEGDLEELTSLFHEISSSPNVKAVISSRPLAVFTDSFQNCPGLRLQDCATQDIQAYVADTLMNDDQFLELAQLDPRSASELTEAILTGSDGSFLWAHLVVQSLRTGLRNGDSLTDLQARVRILYREPDEWGTQPGLINDPVETPESTDNVYNLLWEKIPSLYHADASQTLLLMLAMRKTKFRSIRDGEDTESLTLIDLALAAGDPEETIVAKIRPWEKSELQDYCAMMSAHIRRDLSGFVEIQPSETLGPDVAGPASVIQFSHRTAREYVELIADTKIRDSLSGRDFNPYISLIKSFLHHLKRLHREPRYVLWHFVTTSLLFAWSFEAEHEVSKTYTDLLNQLDQTMQHHHIANLKDEEGNWITKTYKLDNKVKSDLGWNSEKDAELHWANFHPTEEQKREWNSLFLTLAIQYGLRKYVEDCLGIGSKVLRSKKGRPLLDYALSPLPSLQHTMITPVMVQVLLNHGADPNQNIAGKKFFQRFSVGTCWDNALLWQYERFASLTAKGLNLTSEDKKLANIRLSMFEIMLIHGADKRACPRTGRVSVTLPLVIDECFSSCPPDRVKRVRDYITRR